MSAEACFFDDPDKPPSGEFATIFAPSCGPPYILDASGSGCWSEGNPFYGVQSDDYWSATTVFFDADWAMVAALFWGEADKHPKISANRVWPVRGGDPPVCGNSVTDPGEQCDGGGESASCDVDCTLAVCGDGTLNATAGEECDDGNTQDADGDRTTAWRTARCRPREQRRRYTGPWRRGASRRGLSSSCR